MKLKCDCGNTAPHRFSIVCERTVWLAVHWSHDEEGTGVFTRRGALKEETTNSTRLWCDECNTTQEIK